MSQRDDAPASFRQIMAGCALLGWSLEKLAGRAGIDPRQTEALIASGIAGIGSPVRLADESIRQMTSCLIQAGVTFSGTAAAPGVQLVAPGPVDEGLRPEDLNAQNDG